MTGPGKKGVHDGPIEEFPRDDDAVIGDCGFIVNEDPPYDPPEIDITQVPPQSDVSGN